jgi:hypothetical protein
MHHQQHRPNDSIPEAKKVMRDAEFLFINLNTIKTEDFALQKKA